MKKIPVASLPASATFPPPRFDSGREWPNLKTLWNLRHDDSSVEKKSRRAAPLGANSLFLCLNTPKRQTSGWPYLLSSACLVGPPLSFSDELNLTNFSQWNGRLRSCLWDKVQYLPFVRFALSSSRHWTAALFALHTWESENGIKFYINTL